MQPLLFPKGPFDPALAHDQFSYLFWVYPLAAAWLGAQAFRGRRGELGLLLTWSAACCVLALLQQRFTDAAGPAFALVMGPALVEGVRRFPARGGARQPWCCCAASRRSARMSIPTEATCSPRSPRAAVNASSSAPESASARCSSTSDAG
jgi:hypothetical protein